jgi:FdhD protein
MSTIENAQKGENAVDMPPPGPDPSPPGDTVTVSLRFVEAGTVVERTDEVATEEPLEVRVLAGEGPERRHSIAVTMRTPGHDRELAAGFLFTEGILTRPDQVRDIAHCAPGRPNSGNIVNVALAPGTPFDASRLSRNVYTTSSCGICGKTSLDMVRAVLPGPVSGEFRLEERAVLELSRRLRRSQILFSRTGGLHAAALFDALGALLRVREDVGRHNAVDKIVGSLFLEGRLPAGRTLLWVSGRAGYELVQKALMAGIPVLAAVGAPTSLAVAAAREFGMTLIGFLREGRFNVYAGEHRVVAGRSPGNGNGAP